MLLIGSLIVRKIVRYEFEDIMGLALFAFIAIFLLIGSAGLLIFYRAAMMQRLSAAIAPHASGRVGGTILSRTGPESRSGRRPAVR